MNESTQVAQVVRGWELPLSALEEGNAINAVRQLSQVKNMTEDDFSLVLNELTEKWKNDGSVDSGLKLAIETALGFVPSIIKNLDASAYFALYKRLTTSSKDVAGLSGSIARRLLSRSSLIAHLLKVERFSCSQIARLLASTDASLDVSHGSIVYIARKLELLPELSDDEAGQKLWNSDQKLAVILYPDSTVKESNEITAAEIHKWISEIDLRLLLDALSGPDEQRNEPAWPYLQILHWCLVPIEFYDHPASYLYEFGPRGRIALELFGRYPTVTGNPVLNNAKAVQTLNTTWSRNRGGLEAHALVDVLNAVESLPYVSRRQVARILRAWVIRVIELCTVSPVLISERATDPLFNKIVSYVQDNETNTQGVLEQKIVDCLTELVYGNEGWRSRGLGDGVNASNYSRRKLGDVEFANVDERKAIAIEAHGGFLSAVYVQGHTRSLSRIVKQRLDESWSAIDEPSSWSIQVIFVAHARAQTGLPNTDIMHGIRISYRYIDYSDLIRQALSASTALERSTAFEKRVIEEINAPTVREIVRNKFREIVNY